MLRTKTTRHLLYIAFAVLMCILYYNISLRVVLNSDIASALLEAKDISSGNFILKGWSLSTGSFFFTEIIWYALLIKVLGYSYELAHIVPSIYLVFLCFLTIMLSENKKMGFLFSLFFIGSPTLFLAINILHTVIHVGTYIFCLISLTLALKYINNAEKKNLLLLFPLLLFAYASDSIALYIFLLPNLIVLFLSVMNIRFKKDTRWAHLLVVNLVGAAGSFVIKKFIAAHGFVIPGLFEIKFASFDQVLQNTSVIFQGILDLYEADFFGMGLTHSIVIFNILSFFSLILFISAYISKLLKFKLFDNNDIFLVIASLITPFAFIFSTVSQGPGSIRYILPFFIFGTIFVSRKNIPLLINIRYKLLFTFIILVASFAHIKSTINKPIPTNGAQELSKALKNHGLTHGFAEFWNASSVSVYGDVQIAPVYYNDKNIIQMPWLSKDSWYKDDNNFVIINDENMKKAAIILYGQPDNIIKTAGYTVYSWKKTIIIGH